MSLSSVKTPQAGNVYLKQNICVICGFLFRRQEITPTGHIIVHKFETKKLKLSAERATKIQKVVNNYVRDIENDSNNGICTKCFRHVESVIKLENSILITKKKLSDKRQSVIEEFIVFSSKGPASSKQIQVERLPVTNNGTSNIDKMATAAMNVARYKPIVSKLQVQIPTSPLISITGITPVAQLLEDRTHQKETETSIIPVLDLNSSMPRSNRSMEFSESPNIQAATQSVWESQDSSEGKTFHQCLVCDAIFQQYSELEIHNKTHIKLEQTNCPHDHINIAKKQTDEVPQHDQQEIDSDVHVKIEQSDDDPEKEINKRSETDGQKIDDDGTLNFDNEKSELISRNVADVITTSLSLVHQCKICEEEFEQYCELEKHCQIHLNETSVSVDNNYIVMSLSNVTGESSTSASSTPASNTTPVSPGQALNAELEKHCQNEPSVSVENNYTVPSLSNVTGESSTRVFTTPKIDSACTSTNKTTVSPGQASNAELEKHCQIHFNEPSVLVEKKYTVMSLSNVTGESSTNISANSNIVSACNATSKTTVSPGQASDAELEKHCQIHLNEPSVSVENNYMVMPLSIATGQSLSEVCSTGIDWIEPSSIAAPAIHSPTSVSTNISVSDFKCESSSALLLHIASLTKLKKKDSNLQCGHCDKYFTQKTNLKAHVVRNHFGEKPCKCDICGKAFSSNCSFLEHIKTHIVGLKPHKCDVCGKEFRKRYLLRNHVTTHTGEKPHKCDVCDKSFNQISALKDHHRMHTGDKPYKCEACDKAFTTKKTLTRHAILHMEELPYKCDICDKGFPTNASLNRHKFTHTKLKPFKCEVCDKCFTTLGAVSSHRMIHAKVKHFKCDICEKRFTKAFTLREHSRIHTGEKPFKCGVCHQAFTYACNLKDHLTKHTGEKAYICDVCGKTFGMKKAFQSHIEIHSKEKPFKCDVCGKSFGIKRLFQGHMKIHNRKSTKEKTDPVKI